MGRKNCKIIVATTVALFLGSNRCLFAQNIKPLFGLESSFFLESYYSLGANLGLDYKNTIRVSGKYKYFQFIEGKNEYPVSSGLISHSLGLEFSYLPKIKGAIRPRVAISYAQGMNSIENGIPFNYGNYPTTYPDSTDWKGRFQRVNFLINGAILVEYEIKPVNLYFGIGYNIRQVSLQQKKSYYLDPEEIVITNRGVYFSVGILHIFGKNEDE